MTEPILLSRLHFPVDNLGYGSRAGIWFQGCTIYCRGCISRDTWTFDPATRTDVEAVLAWLRRLDGQVDGVTISGGEPTDQPEALLGLLAGIAEWRGDSEIDVLMYSGRSADTLRHGLPWLWESVDILISEPYEASRAAGCALRGSDNQRVNLLTELARRRYPAESLESTYAPQRTKIGVHVDLESIWLVGLPHHGDLPKLRDHLTERGVELGRTSWLT
ncbi:4Fe-4S cluster-binding domain-containing protein [Skermania piniformis]|uniref:Radical SAM protein n=1 Tax=Skermania pinensis TaxID=39122 RepID=A0ABX8SC13_9ACTN|nr:4Fe-4S cluster-binding domain-containing protein [Skermania piniformis]QXQ15322.1 radical SAM protein [Skermania piniformis]